MKKFGFQTSLRFSLPVFLLFSLYFALFGQSYERVNARGYCQFTSNDGPPDEWLAFPDDSLSQVALIQILLEKGGQTRRKFALRCAMVNVVAAMRDSSGEAVLVFSPSLFEKPTDSLLHLAALAHEIGHLTAGHRLAQRPSEAEELQADRFMGYVLCKLGYSLPQILDVLEKSGHQKSANELARRAAVSEGFQKAQTSIEVADGAGFGEAVREKALKNFPKLDPVPAWSDNYMLKKTNSNWFEGCSTLAQIDTRLCATLDARGFYSRNYWQLEGGFALVTLMEQFDGANGASWPNENDRWKSKPAKRTNGSLTDLLSGFFFPEKGHFRLFVFGVTTANLKPKEKTAVDKTTAEKWLSQGLDGFLPEVVGAQSVLPETKVYACVYEFEMETSNGQSKPVCPASPPQGWKSGGRQAYTHLEKAKILDGLRH